MASPKVQVNITTHIGMNYLIVRLMDTVRDLSADSLSEDQAEVLENAAAEIRRKLAEAKKGE